MATSLSQMCFGIRMLAWVHWSELLEPLGQHWWAQLWRCSHLRWGGGSLWKGAEDWDGLGEV